MKKNKAATGFTLIELSIALIVIGLLVGGVIIGQDLINSAAIRAQITQIDKFQTATHAFEGKYGFLPGDIPDSYAQSFGLQARGSYPGEGDGNDILEGNCTNSINTNGGFYEGDGELAVFWVDLSTAGLIDSNITYNGSRYPNPTTIPSPTVTLNTTPSIKQWLPTAKLGQTNYIYIYSSTQHANYFALSRVDDIGCAVQSSQGPNLTVQQAYVIDNKTDDGLPQTGDVTACYVNHQVVTYQAIWAAGGLNQGAGGANCASATAATPYASTNCFDNNNVAGTQQYSVKQNANQLNCALSFRFH